MHHPNTPFSEKNVSYATKNQFYGQSMEKVVYVFLHTLNVSMIIVCSQKLKYKKFLLKIFLIITVGTIH